MVIRQVPSGRADQRRRDADGDLDTWLAAARAGESDAFGRIWVAWAPRVSGYLRARGVTHVDDVTSEVFVAAFSGFPRFSGGASDFRAWLFTIAHNKSVDDRRRRPDDAAYSPESDTRTSVSAETTALDRSIDLDVRALLSPLTDDQREVLLLRALADMSIDDVATATGRSTGAVKQLYRRAIASCRRASEGGSAPTADAASLQGVTLQALSPITEL